MNNESTQEELDYEEEPIHKARLVVIRPSSPGRRGLLNFEIKDIDAGTRVVDIDVNAAAFLQCLIKLAKPEYWRDAVDCDMRIGQLEVVGKVKKQKTLSFKMPSVIDAGEEKRDIATAMAQEMAGPEWSDGCCLVSFNQKNNEEWAHVLMTRWAKKQPK